MKTTACFIIASIAFSACTFNVSSADTSPTATYSGTGWSTLSVQTGSDRQNIGSVEMHGNANTTDVTATAHLSGLVSNGDQSAFAATVIQFNQTGDSLAPSVVLPPTVNPEEAGQIDLLTLAIPATANVETNTDSTDLTIDGITGSVHATAVSGNVRVTTTGAVTATTSSGDIAVQSGSNVTIQSASGNARVTGTGGSVRATSGDVDVTWSGTESLTIVVTSGNVAIHVPSTAAFHMEASATSGHVAVAPDPTHSGHDGTFTGDINGGGPVILSVNATSGNIAVAE